MVMRRKYETTIRSSGWSRSVKITGCLRLRGKPIPHWPMVRCPSMSSMWANDPKRMSPFESRTPSLSEGCNAMSVQRNDIPCSRHTSWLQYRQLLGILPRGISRLYILVPTGFTTAVQAASALNSSPTSAQGHSGPPGYVCGAVEIPPNTSQRQVDTASRRGGPTMLANTGEARPTTRALDELTVFIDFRHWSRRLPHACFDEVQEPRLWQ